MKKKLENWKANELVYQTPIDPYQWNVEQIELGEWHVEQLQKYPKMYEIAPFIVEYTSLDMFYSTDLDLLVKHKMRHNREYRDSVVDMVSYANSEYKKYLKK